MRLPGLKTPQDSRPACRGRGRGLSQTALVTPPGGTFRLIARLCFWALIALIVFGIVLIFARIPAGWLIYSVIGLVIFAGFTMLDFQRLRRSKDISSAPLMAASIFLDVLNVFLFFLRIFSSGNR